MLRAGGHVRHSKVLVDSIVSVLLNSRSLVVIDRDFNSSARVIRRAFNNFARGRGGRGGRGGSGGGGEQESKVTDF